MNEKANGYDSGQAPEVRTGVGQTDYKRSLAYQRLGIRPQDVEVAPFFRAQLRRITRCVNRGRAEYWPLVGPLDLLHYSDNPEARQVLEKYLSVPKSYRRLLPVEAFCQAAGVSPWRVLEIVAGVAVRKTAEMSAVVAAILSPRVVEKTVERALQDDGVRERTALLKAIGPLLERYFASL